MSLSEHELGDDRILSMVERALKLPAAERRAFLEEACSGDTKLLGQAWNYIQQEEHRGDDLRVPLLAPSPGPKNRPLSAGARFGSYEILALIGAGAMGEVYRAHDHKLCRDVAVKVLPEAFADSPMRFARFEREARVLASLNHPNIAAIYGLEAFYGKQFLVMELVEGETVAEYSKRIGPAPPKDALRICDQIAEGLEAAHLKGVTHRDVKPANVKVTPEGRVKVLDFGLAKAIWRPRTGPDVSHVTTVTEVGTEHGQIVGTPSYMSPEQARGMVVDQRTDVWALGCVLFELLGGKRAFRGDTLSDTIAAILDREPNWATLPAGTPAGVRNLLHRCLQKDPALRFQNMRDVRTEFEAIRAGHRSQASTRKLIAVFALLAMTGGAALVPPVRRSLLHLIPVRAIRQEKHLAVLPFLNVGKDPANQVFCDGLVESLTSNLTQLERFHDTLLVVPSAEVRRQAAVSPSDARRSFGVNLVVTGSVQRMGDEIRVTVNLTDARTLRQLGSREISLRREDLSKMEDSLPGMVAELLEVQIPPPALSAMKTGSTQVSDAYDAYVRGRGYLRRYDREGNLELAIAAFNLALQRDSHYALAYCGLGEAYWRDFDRTKSPEWLVLAQEATARAIELNDQLAAAHVNLGMTYVSSGRYELATREFQRALTIDSLNPDAYRELGRAYEALNQMKDAESTYQHAIQLRPNDWLSNSQLGVFYYQKGQYADAERLFQKVISLTPDNVNGYSNLGGLYVAWGRYSQAESLLKKAIEVKPSDSRAHSNLGTLYFQLGRYREAVPMFEQALGKSRGPDYTLQGNLADSYRWAVGYQAKAPPAYRRAIELAEQQLAINPNNAAVLGSIALYRAKLGEVERAKKEIARARKLAPADQALAENAAVVLELSGRRADALVVVGELLKSSRAEIESDPELSRLRQDPVFIRMVSQLPPATQ